MWRNGAYIRVKWENGKAVQEYIGSGPGAELAAMQDEIEREQRKEQVLEIRKRAEEWKALEDSVTGALDDVRDLVAGVLMATGHHRRKRQWRKRRGD